MDSNHKKHFQGGEVALVSVTHYFSLNISFAACTPWQNCAVLQPIFRQSDVFSSYMVYYLLCFVGLTWRKAYKRTSRKRSSSRYSAWLGIILDKYIWPSKKAKFCFRCTFHTPISKLLWWEILCYNSVHIRPKDSRDCKGSNIYLNTC